MWIVEVDHILRGQSQMPTIVSEMLELENMLKNEYNHQWNLHGA
jgi:hypothetical protein